MIQAPLRFRLEDMRDYAREAIGIFNATDVPTERMRDLSLERVISIVGEAATKVPPEVRALAPEIDWSRLTGMRHVLVHDYATVRKEVIEDVVRRRLPTLITAIERLLAEGEDNI